MTVRLLRRRGGGRGPRLLLATAASLALALTACAAPESGTGSSGGSSGVQADDSGPIRIGVNLELSGPAAVLGAANRNAVELIAEQVNADGGVLDGRKIELVIRDNKSDPTESLQVAKSLVQSQKVVAMVGPGSSPTTLSLVDYADSVGLPMVSMGSSDAIVSPVEDRSTIFKTPANAALVAEVMLREFEERGITDVGFISVDNPYGDSGITEFRKAASDAGVNIVAAEKFQETDKDHTSVVTKVAAESPDAIVVWAIPPGAGIVAKNIADSNYDGPVYFDSGAGAELFLQGAGEAAEGSRLVHPATLVADTIEDAANLDVMRSFHETYTEKYGEYSGFASYGADALRIIVQAIEAAGTTDPQKVRDAMEGMDYTGITGVYHFSPMDHAGLTPDSLVVVGVENGQWTLASQ